MQNMQNKAVYGVFNKKRVYFDSPTLIYLVTLQDLCENFLFFSIFLRSILGALKIS